MNEKFKSESDLVDSFIIQYEKKYSGIFVKELPIRYGNIDVVRIKNSALPFSMEQIDILSRPSAALIFTKIKNERPISRNSIEKNVGLSGSTIAQTLSMLLSTGLIEKTDNGCFFRKTKFVFPKTMVVGYEAKLTDFNKAFYQAKGNKEYVDYSYLVFPLDIARRLVERKRELLEHNGIGLIGVSETRTFTLLRATKTGKMKDSIRLLGLVKANQMIN